MRHERRAFDAVGAWASRCTLIESARMFYCTSSLRDGTGRRRNEEHRQRFCFYWPISAIGFFYSSTDSASMPTRSTLFARDPVHLHTLTRPIFTYESDTESIAHARIPRDVWPRADRRAATHLCPEIFNFMVPHSGPPCRSELFSDRVPTHFRRVPTRLEMRRNPHDHEAETGKGHSPFETDADAEKLVYSPRFILVFNYLAQIGETRR